MRERGSFYKKIHRRFFHKINFNIGKHVIVSLHTPYQNLQNKKQTQTEVKMCPYSSLLPNFKKKRTKKVENRREIMGLFLFVFSPASPSFCQGSATRTKKNSILMSGFLFDFPFIISIFSKVE